MHLKALRDVKVERSHVPVLGLEPQAAAPPSDGELGQLLQGCGLVLSREELQVLALKAAPQDTARVRVNASAMNTRAVSIAAAMTFIAGLVR